MAQETTDRKKKVRFLEDVQVYFFQQEDKLVQQLYQGDCVVQSSAWELNNDYGSQPHQTMYDQDEAKLAAYRRAQIRRHEGEEYNFFTRLNDAEIVGQDYEKWIEKQNELGNIPLTPFNMEEERTQGGDFDHWLKIDRQKEDAWLSSLDDMDQDSTNGSAGANDRLYNSTADAVRSEYQLNQPVISQEDIIRHLRCVVDNSREGESVLDALRRLGVPKTPSFDKISIIRRHTLRDDNVEPFNDLTEAADELLKSGMIDIYGVKRQQSASRLKELEAAQAAQMMSDESSDLVLEVPGEGQRQCSNDVPGFPINIDNLTITSSANTTSVNTKSSDGTNQHIDNIILGGANQGVPRQSQIESMWAVCGEEQQTNGIEQVCSIQQPSGEQPDSMELDSQSSHDDQVAELDTRQIESTLNTALYRDTYELNQTRDIPGIDESYQLDNLSGMYYSSHYGKYFDVMNGRYMDANTGQWTDRVLLPVPVCGPLPQ